jgi:oligopeptide transport system substrate-binding protein
MKLTRMITATIALLTVANICFAKNKVFRYSEDSAPSNFDPVVSSVLYSNQIVTAVYDTLYSYRYLKRPYELKPNLAEALPEVSKDELTYTFKIKKGVKFQDNPCFKDGKGREVTADDFVYSMKRHFDPKERSQGAWLWQGKIVGLDAWKDAGANYKATIEGLKALDKYTIQIKLTKKFPQLVHTFTMGFTAFVPEEAVKTYGQELSIKPVGSGPWLLKSHTAKKTVLVRNPNYRGEVFDAKAEGYDPKVHGFTKIGSLDGKTMPFMDEIEVNWMPENVARWNSFTKGNEIQTTTLSVEYVDAVLAAKSPLKLKPKFAEKYEARAEEEAGLIFTHFNMDSDKFGHSKDPVQNKKNHALRCAIRKSNNYKSVIDKFYLGIGTAYPGFIPRNLDGYDENLSKESVTLDIAGAKKLLADNGWNASNLPQLEYGSVASVQMRQIFENFRGSMAAIGYPANKIKLKTYPTFGDFNKDIKNRKLDFIPMGWGLDYPDAENTLALFYGPNASPGANSANYMNPEYDKIFEQASTMQPGPERTALFKKLNQIIIDDCVTISAYSRTRVFVWEKNAVIWPQRDIVGNIFKYLDVSE